MKSCAKLKNVNFISQKEVISQAIKTEQPEKVMIDRGGIGMQLAEDLEKDFSQCKGIAFNVNLKNEIVTNTKELMEQGLVANPKNSFKVKNLFLPNFSSLAVFNSVLFYRYSISLNYENSKNHK